MDIRNLIKKGPLVLIISLLLVSSARYAFGQAEPKTHVVGAIDNYFSISIKYNVSIEDLKKANPGITSPKPGDVLIIPSQGVASIPEKHIYKPNRSAGRDPFRIALMVPFYLEHLGDNNWRQKLDPSKLNEIAPFRFVQFYHGFLMAADSLAKKGLNAEIYVYDVDQQVQKARQAIASPELKEMDLIIGPLLKGAFEEVAAFAGENHIPIVNPLSTRNDILVNNPYVFKLSPSVESQPKLVADLVRRDFIDHNIIFYIPNRVQNTRLIGKYTEAIGESLANGNRDITVIDYATDSIRGFQSHASASRPNLIVIFSENEVLPAALMNKLNAMKSDYEMTVIGLPEWDKFTNIELGYMMPLNAHVLMANYVDYRSDAIKGFVNNYRVKYLDEPLTYAFSGFDAGYYFLGALMEFGKDFIDHTDEIRIPVIQNQFHFQRKDNEGFDNINWNVLYYYDYSLFRKYSY